MRHPAFAVLCLSGAVALSACQKGSDAQVQRALKDVNVIDESNLNDVMLSVADPNEAVNYFTRTLQQNPDRIDLMRGLARSLARAPGQYEPTRDRRGYPAGLFCQLLHPVLRHPAAR